MPSTTGIEIAADSCVLVGVRPRAGSTGELRALRRVPAAEWPASEAARTDLLRSIRRDERLPRRAVVVAWNLPEPADGRPARTALEFVEAAGFTIESILSPPQALARLAGMHWRQGSPGATAWTALNTDGAAIGIVSGHELLFAAAFNWSFTPGLTETRAQLLQRYSLVAHLAPQLRHGIDVVRASHGVAVDRVVTCGNLPDLRSLTMPLIEELDLEVETLDMSDGLRASGQVTADRLSEALPAIRLACAAALTEPSPSALNGVTFMQHEPSALMRVAAVIALVGALAWGTVSFRTLWMPVPVKPVPVAQSAPRQPAQPRHSAQALSSERSQMAAPETRNDSTPVSTVLSVQTDRKNDPAPEIPDPAPQAAAAVPRGSARQHTNELPARAAAPLAEPLPQVDSILIDQERRLAVIDGAVVSAGDLVGRRTVVGIERDAVILREPSGLVVRASVRARRTR